VTNVQPQQEPSMEEILASIRRIISDEPGAAPAAKADDGVLDLTPDMQVNGSNGAHVMPESEPAPPSPPQPAPAPTMDALMASFETNKPEPPLAPETVAAFAPLPEPEPASTYTPPPLTTAPAPSMTVDDRLISMHTEAAAAAALSGLSALGQHKFETGTVEALVRELLKPLLKEWLDANLPTIIERMVEGEIERLSRRAKSVN
jgi:uncharacterized protein